MTVIAIIGIVFGALGVLCVGGGLVMTITGKTFSVNGNATELPAQAKNVSIAVQMVGFVLWGLLLVGSIGALLLLEWARKLLLGVSVVDLLYGVIKLVLSMMIILPATIQLMQQNAAPNQPANMASITRSVAYITAVVMWVVSMILPIVTLVLFRKPDVVAAFRSDQPPAMA